MKPSEYAALRAGWRNTTVRSFSEYIRSILCRDPVVKKCRNASLDEILETLIDIKNEVTTVSASAQGASANEAIETIKSLLLKIYQKCAQKE